MLTENIMIYIQSFSYCLAVDEVTNIIFLNQNVTSNCEEQGFETSR